MKHKAFFAAIIIVLYTLALSGCVGENAAAPSAAGVFSRPFRLSADYTRQEDAGAFDFCAAGSQSCELTFSLPRHADGMSARLENGVVTREFLGISDECELTRLERAHPLRALSSLLLSLESTGDTDESVSISFCEDGTPSAIVFDELSLRLEITFFEYTD